MKPLTEWTTAELERESAYLRRQLADRYRDEPHSAHIAFAAHILVRPDGTSECRAFTIGQLNQELKRRKREHK